MSELTPQVKILGVALDGYRLTALLAVGIDDIGILITWKQGPAVSITVLISLVYADVVCRRLRVGLHPSPYTFLL